MTRDDKIIAQIIHERNEWQCETGSKADIVFMPDNLLSQQVTNIEDMEVRYSPLIPKGSFILSVKSRLSFSDVVNPAMEPRLDFSCVTNPLTVNLFAL
jgi:hypothetical protein